MTRPYDEEPTAEVFGEAREARYRAGRDRDELAGYFPRGADDVPGIEAERPEDYLRDDLRDED